MVDHFRKIYANKADLYERMVSREDYRGNILPALLEITPLDGQTVVELGAGTGRLTRLLGFYVQRIHAFDLSPAMLAVAKSTLELTGMTNWTLAVGDNRKAPVRDGFADLTIAGWSFGHAQSWYPDTWRDEIDSALSEMARIVRPGGTIVILETMGTGQKQPAPPHEGLAAYYAWLENEHGFSYTWIRTDYQFESVAEADELTRFFFGDELADRIVREQMAILPECTGIWWKTV
jgi:ubiquinone/menaquinone biosynthesis C-methylase UbiE